MRENIATTLIMTVRIVMMSRTVVEPSCSFQGNDRLKWRTLVFYSAKQTVTHNTGELVGVEARSAYQYPVDIGLFHDLGNIA